MENIVLGRFVPDGWSVWNMMGDGWSVWNMMGYGWSVLNMMGDGLVAAASCFGQFLSYSLL